MLTIDLPPELETRVTGEAARLGLSTADYVRDALAQHLEDLDDLGAAEAALEDIRSGRSSTGPLEEVERKLGLAD